MAIGHVAATSPSLEWRSSGWYHIALSSASPAGADCASSRAICHHQQLSTSIIRKRWIDSHAVKSEAIVWTCWLRVSSRQSGAGQPACQFHNCHRSQWAVETKNVPVWRGVWSPAAYEHYSLSLRNAGTNISCFSIPAACTLQLPIFRNSLFSNFQWVSAFIAILAVVHCSSSMIVSCLKRFHSLLQTVDAVAITWSSVIAVTISSIVQPSQISKSENLHLAMFR